MVELCHAGAHNKYESFDVWFEANGPELIDLDEILDKFCVAYGGYTLRSEIEAPLITRENLPETYFFVGDYGS